MSLSGTSSAHGRSLHRRAVLSLMAAAACLRPAKAQDATQRPIRMVAPFTPGSPVDVVARLLAQHLSAELKRSVVVENRPGAGTTLGMRSVLLAEPDGTTLLFQSSSLVVAPAMYRTLEFDPLKAFAPVSNVAWGSWVTVVSPELPVQSAQELITYARANPGRLNFGFGQGTAPQLVGEWFNKSHGLVMTSVPYRGGMQAVTDMMGGTIHLNIGTTATLLPLIRAGKVRAIAQWGRTREADLPEVPTMIESGFPGLALGFWAGLWVPRATPDAVVASLNKAMTTVLRQPAMIESMAKLGVQPSPGTPEEFAAFLANEAPRWAEIVSVSGAQVE